MFLNTSLSLVKSLWNVCARLFLLHVHTLNYSFTKKRTSSLAPFKDLTTGAEALFRRTSLNFRGEKKFERKVPAEGGVGRQK